MFNGQAEQDKFVLTMLNGALDFPLRYFVFISPSFKAYLAGVSLDNVFFVSFSQTRELAL